MGTFSLVELNIANYDDHTEWPQRLPMIVDAVAGCDADLIALSEIRYTATNSSNINCATVWESTYGVANPCCACQDMGDQIVTLLRTRGAYENDKLSIVTNQAMVYSTDPPQWEGLSIITRWPIVAAGYRTLSAWSDGNARISQYAAIQLPDGEAFYLFNTHFSTTIDDHASNATDTLALIGRVLPPSVPFVLAGDLNTVTIPDQGTEQLVRAGLRDAWPLVNPNVPGPTWPNPEPCERRDSVWVPAGVTVDAGELIATDPSDGVYASDHCGLCFELST